MSKRIVLKEGKIYMLKNKELRLEVIQLHHNILVAEHGESSRKECNIGSI